MKEFDLNSLRNELDQIDSQLVSLWERRMNIVLNVAEYKKQNNMQIYDKNRELQVIEKNVALLKNPDYAKALADVFESIMAVSRRKQHSLLQENQPQQVTVSPKKNLRIAYQGIQGAFSEQALKEYFMGKDYITKNFSEFEDVFQALKDGIVDYGVLPIENSSTGGISEVCDLLRKYGLYIIGEKVVKIDQNLMALPTATLEDISQIYSHPQGFRQCMEYLNNNRQWQIIPYSNTALSAKLVHDRQDKTLAAIASKNAAELYDLNIIAENINDNNNNHTLFIIIGRELEQSPLSNKVSTVLSVPHKPGTLYAVLEKFHIYDLNLIKIESRPQEGKQWEYFFYIDFVGNMSDPHVQQALGEIKQISTYFKMLGNYQSNS